MKKLIYGLVSLGFIIGGFFIFQSASYPIPDIKALESAMGHGNWWDYLHNSWVKEYYVSPGGYDTNSGMDGEHPFLTIQKAVDQASTTKYTIIHLIPYQSSAGTIADFDDDDTTATSVTTGNQRLANAWIYVYKSNIHFIGHGSGTEVLIKPDVAATAGIFVIKTGVKNISFENIVFDATTAANEIIGAGTTGVLENITIRNCKFTTGTSASSILALDLDVGLVTNLVVEGCLFVDIHHILQVQPVGGRFENNIVQVEVPAVTTAGKVLTIPNNSGTKGFLIKNNLINGGTASSTSNYTHGIEIVGTNTVGCSIIGNFIVNCDDLINDNGTNTANIGNLTTDGTAILTAITPD